MSEFSVIGKSVPLKDGLEKVTGRAKYYGDVMLPGMWHMKILRSPYAQADIRAIHSREAEGRPGVELVMTHQNFPKIFKKDLHYVGDEVAAVVARDEETAEEACDLIQVEYEPKPFVLNIVEAMKPEAPRVFPDRPNIRPGWGPGFKYFYFSEKDPETGLWTKKEESDFHGFGDVEKGFLEADLIVEDSDVGLAYSRSPTMEPRGCVASFEHPKLTVWTHSHHLHHDRNYIAKFFGLLPDQINLVSPFTGGSFGGKNEKRNTKIHIAVAATLSLGRPVKLVLTREEEMLHGWSRGSLSGAKLGFKKDGRLTTMEMDHWIEVGPDGDAYTLRTVYRHTGAMLYSRNCQHLKIKAGAVFTNRFVCVGWRGYGCPEANFLIETLMDQASHLLGIDPVELRRKNHFRPGDPIASAGDSSVRARISSCGLEDCLDEGVRRSDWKRKWKPPDRKKGRWREGMGMALQVHGAGFGYYSTAVVKVSQEATALLECSIADMGQGQHTVQSQIVAEVLGIPYENVRIICHDTDSAPYATKTVGSQGTWHQGKATYQAAFHARQQILQFASGKLDTPPENLAIHHSRIYSKTNPEKGCTFSEAFGDLAWKGSANVPWSFSPPSMIPTIIGVGQTFPDGRDEGIYPREQAAHFTELAIDTETGRIKIRRHFPVHYIGRALNPKIVEGQITAGVYQGLEMALFGECVSDPQTGKMLTYNWEYYKPLPMLDLHLEPVMVEIPGLDRSHPFGAIACGEGAVNPVCSVVSNAIYNAIGRRLKSTPFTPARVLQALETIKDDEIAKNSGPGERSRSESGPRGVADPKGATMIPRSDP